MDNTIQWLQTWFKEKTGEEIDINSNYLEAGIIDSLAVFDLILSAENHFKITFSEDDLFNGSSDSILGLSKVIESKISR